MRMVQPLPLLLVAGTLSLLCGACATLGSAFEFHPSGIAVGKTTKGELLSEFGRPSRVGYDNGDEKWAYGYYHYSLFSASDVRELDVVFKDGVVSSYTYESSDPGEIAKQLPAGASPSSSPTPSF